MSSNATLALTMDLMRRPSITPRDEGCQQMLATRLARRGFQATHLRYGDVDNLWLRRGQSAPLLAFIGHTDVVPPGPADAWRSDPFAPEIRDGYLYGRGAADMKGSIAAMVVAMERFVERHPDHPGSIALLLTSDEEGPSVDGTIRVVEWLTQNNVKIDWCLVGEPSSTERLGDVIKNGRRGSLNGRLTVRGIQGHVAYPQNARNPIRSALPALQALNGIEWDTGNAYFPPTTFEFSNISSGTGAENVIPGTLTAWFNLRYSTQWTATDLQDRITGVLDGSGLDYDCMWRKSGDPFLTPSGPLLEAVTQAIIELTGQAPEVSTGGGTSDGRFVAPTGAEVVELGPVNATIHKVNECVAVQDLDGLARLYDSVLRKLLMASCAAGTEQHGPEKNT